MNNNNLINLINLYGGNDDPHMYTSSLLNKYNTSEDKFIIKINNLETLLVSDHDSDSENDDIFKLIGGNSTIKLNLNNIVTDETESFTEIISKKIQKTNRFNPIYRTNKNH